MKPRLNFPGLNGVRFLAALLVIVDHTEEFKQYFGGRSALSDQYVAHLGSVGVTIFFSLSGFLITYLLLLERAISGSVAIKAFYIRRILRIWPVYYLCTALGFFVVPHIGFLAIPGYGDPVQVDIIPKLMLFLFLLPNVAFVTLPTVPFANVLWSVGVEEQFYLFWPHLVRHLKHPILVALGIFFAVKAVALVLPDKTLALLLTRTRFSCMLLGAGAAYLLFLRRPLVERYLFPVGTQLLTWLALLFMIFRAPRLPYPASVLTHELVAGLTAVLILNISQNARTIVRLENRVLDYLGKRSYGLYVYHLFGVVGALALLPGRPAYTPVDLVLWSVGVSLLGFAISLALAHLSYRYLEQPFLQNKEKFATIVSGDLARTTSVDIDPAGSIAVAPREPR